MRNFNHEYTVNNELRPNMLSERISLDIPTNALSKIIPVNLPRAIKRDPRVHPITDNPLI